MTTSDAPRIAARTRVLRALAVVITLALLAWFVVDARWHGVGRRLLAFDPWSLLGVAGLFAASYAMRGARIAGEFRDEVGRGNYFRILRLTLVHNALVNVLPFRSGEAAFPILLVRWFGVGSGRAVVSLLWLRTQDACVVLALAAWFWPGLAIAWRVAALMVIAAGAWAVPQWARRHRLASREAGGRVAKLQGLLDRSTRGGASGWLWTIGNWSVKLVAEAWLLTMALGQSPPGAPSRLYGWGNAMLGAVGAELAAILPVQGVAGFGTFEAGAAALMRTQGVAVATGLEAALALHAVVLALALIAGGLAAIALPGPRAH